MRFTNVLVALGSVAGIVGMLQGVNFRSSIDVVNENAGTATAHSIKWPRNVHLTPRILAPTYTRKTNGVFSLGENQWVLSNVVKPGDAVSVVDVTGCSALFFWDENNIPSAFHIFCGNEQSDGAAASKMVEDTPVSVYIGARSDADYETLKAAVKTSFTNLKDSQFTKEVYAKPPSDEAYKFEAVAGTVGVTMETQARVFLQPNRF